MQAHYNYVDSLHIAGNAQHVGTQMNEQWKPEPWTSFLSFLKYFYIHLKPYRLYKYFAPKCSSYIIEVYDTAYSGLLKLRGIKLQKQQQ